MIELTKQYRTRDGREVRIYAVEEAGKWPIHGAVLYEPEGAWCSMSWKANGTQGLLHEPSDLIEVPKRIKREYWVNVYPETIGSAYKDKETCKDNRSDEAIACVKIAIDCEEGEGL